jgi:hypothetical protein
MQLGAPIILLFLTPHHISKRYQTINHLSEIPQEIEGGFSTATPIRQRLSPQTTSRLVRTNSNTTSQLSSARIIMILFKEIL